MRPQLVLGAVCAGLTAQDPAPEFAPQREFVESCCFDCHGGGRVEGDLDLSQVLDDDVARLVRLDRMRRRVLAGEMPPSDPEDPGEALPPVEERQAFARWVDEVLWREVPQLPPDPGRVTIRRLNAAQWQRTVADLFGVEVDTSGFPPDDLAYGFDTIGDALSFSTLHLEKYLAAAGVVAERVLTGEDPEHPPVRRLQAGAMEVASGTVVERETGMANLLTRATITQIVRAPRAGRFLVRVSARADQAGDELARMLLRCDGRSVREFEIPGEDFGEFAAELAWTEGEHRLALTFLNDFYEPTNPDPKRRDRNLRIDWCEVVGPLDPPIVPHAQRWVHDALARKGDPATRLRAFAAELLPRVWRRPVRADEEARYAAIGKQVLADGGDQVAAARLLLQAALASPNFLFRGEGERSAAGDAVQPVASVAMASRLSYFLWASGPDDRLRELGQQGALARREVLLDEARRLLADERADALATEFCAQWFELRNLGAVAPDPERFPGFDADLRRGLRRETELLFSEVQRAGRDVRELLDCDHTFVDRRLAAFYGLEVPAEVADGGFVRVTLPAAQRHRGGVLGHAGILAVTSNPTRTSPVKRGKWILENVLGAAPPPPPVVNGLANETAIDSSRTFREQLAQHRASRDCAVCHVRMDALGLTLERFDAVGRYRERDAGGVIDASGQLPDGRTIDGLVGLKQVLRDDPAFVHTFAQKLFVYGVGREPRPIDRLRLDRAVAALLRADKVTVADLVLLIVASDAFRLRPGRPQGS